MSTYDEPNGVLQLPGSHRSFVYVAAGFAALGGLLFGYDTGVISGAVLFLKNDFALSTFALEAIVSGVLVGAAIGSFVGGRLADVYGRRGLLFATALIFAAGAIALRRRAVSGDVDRRPGDRRPRHRPRLRYGSRLHLRSLGTRRPGLASLALSTGHHDRHCAGLPGRLCVGADAGLASDVGPGGGACGGVRRRHVVPARESPVARQTWTPGSRADRPGPHSRRGGCGRRSAGHRTEPGRRRRARQHRGPLPSVSPIGAGRRLGTGRVSANHRHQHGDLLRAGDHPVRGNFERIRRDPGHAWHRRRQRDHDRGRR